MVTNPEFYIDTMKDYNIHNFTFHYEATLEKTADVISEAKNNFKRVGISVRPKTPISALNDDVLQNIDLLLVMSVEPGFGGQSFIESTYDKLDEIQEIKKRLGVDFMVQVDGGVSDQNSKKLISAAAFSLNGPTSGSSSRRHATPGPRPWSINRRGKDSRLTYCPLDGKRRMVSSLRPSASITVKAAAAQPAPGSLSRT